MKNEELIKKIKRLIQGCDAQTFKFEGYKKFWKGKKNRKISITVLELADSKVVALCDVKKINLNDGHCADKWAMTLGRKNLDNFKFNKLAL